MSNWFFFSWWTHLTPLMVRVACSHRSNPSIGLTLCLTLRWSCSITVFSERFVRTRRVVGRSYRGSVRNPPNLCLRKGAYRHSH
jgi:hypothetical protein